MKKNTFVPISVLLGALLLALVAAMTPFVAEPTYAQTANTNSLLSNLTLSVGELDPAFSATQLTYGADVPNRTAGIRVTATPDIRGAQVIIKYGTDFDTGTNASGGSIPLVVGANPIHIQVRALDYDVTAPTALISNYVVTVTRIVTGFSDDADLTDLMITDDGTAVALSPDFDNDVTSYTALVPNGTTPLTVTPMAATGATFVIMPGSSAAASDVSLSVGSNVITIMVTAADLVATKTYRLTVTQAAENASDDARLRSLRLSGITLSETFELDRAPTGTPAVVSYSANVPYRTEQTTVTFAVNQPGARTTVESPDDFNAVASGHQVFLGVGETIITIVVMAENAKTEAEKTYTVTVKRAAANASDNANLITNGDGFGLAITGSGAGGATAAPVTALPTLSPGFDSDVTSYTALVSSDTTTLIVTARAHTDAAAPVVTSNKGSGKVGPNTGTGNVAMHAVTLDAGVNVITIKVTAADYDATKTYTLTVTQAAANASDDARLSALMVGGKSVPVSFFTLADDAVEGAPLPVYMTGVANGVSSIAIIATPNHSGAKVAIETGASEATVGGGTAGWTVDADGVVGLAVDPNNNIRIEVTPENGSAATNYFLVIERAAAGASDNAKLITDEDDASGLDIMGVGAGGATAAPVTALPTLSPGFDSDVTSYTALVSSDTTTLIVTARAHTDAAAPVVTSNKGSGKVGPNTGTGNVAMHAVTLDAGVNVITIKVTAADYDATKTYTLTVTQAAANASDDARLSALMVGGKSVPVSFFTLADDAVEGTPLPFYMTGVANGVSSIAIIATPNHSGAMVAIETGASEATVVGGTAGWTVDADGVVDLVIADLNYIRIEVTPENGSAATNYFLVINRVAAGLSGNAKLTNLTLTSATMSPLFSANTIMYSADVPDYIASTTVQAIAATTATSVVITSDKDDTLGPDLHKGDVNGAQADVAYGTSHTIELSAGVNVLTIVVTAADYETTATYTVRVTRGISNDARLSSLSLMDGDGMAIALMDMDGMTAEFMADTMMYYADVDAGVEMINVMATAMSSDATVSGDGAVSLDAGENTITVTVTAENGTTMMTYTVTVTVASPVEGDLLDRYDADDDNQISKDEAIAAINDYLFGEGDQQITKAQVIEVINLYLFG